MLDFPRWKIVTIIALCVMAAWASLPSMFPHVKSPLLLDKTVNLGLDLQGGSYLLLDVDVQNYLSDQLDQIGKDMRDILKRNKIDGKRIGYVGGIKREGDRVGISLRDATMVNDVKRLIKTLSADLDVNAEGRDIFVSYHDQAKKRIGREVLAQSIEIVRRRVDPQGNKEPDIQQQGNQRIILQVPGVENPEEIKQLLGRTAKMTFHMLDEKEPYPAPSSGVVSPGSRRVISGDGLSHYVIKADVSIDGKLLKDAKAAMREGRSVVNIRFNQLGAKKFGDITSEHLGRPFAVVLDNKVLTAPVIRATILDGSAEISGSFSAAEAHELAILLRSGALPAKLSILEERSVGPSLGSDSIQAGKMAIMIGFVMVMVFMILIYGRFGLVANLALVVNVAIIIAALSLFGSTLTLPGLAGIVLTIGMAVDANVLIFERIREEVRLGKTPFAAADHGFQHAFKTILDANVTTLIAAVTLFCFGSGPIKGFAVTLSIGILASMFTAILLTRMVIVLWLKRTKPKELVI